MMSRRRWGWIIPARQVAMYLCHHIRKLPSTTIGRHFGRDHSTVLSAIAKVSSLMAEDEMFALRVTALEARLQSDAPSIDVARAVFLRALNDYLTSPDISPVLKAQEVIRTLSATAKTSKLARVELSDD
jgi:hypothetical protein